MWRICATILSKRPISHSKPPDRPVSSDLWQVPKVRPLLKTIPKAFKLAAVLYIFLPFSLCLRFFFFDPPPPRLSSSLFNLLIECLNQATSVWHSTEPMNFAQVKLLLGFVSTYWTSVPEDWPKHALRTTGIQIAHETNLATIFDLISLLLNHKVHGFCRSTSLAINLVLSALNVTSGTSISFTRDPATDKSSSFILRCVVPCIQTFFIFT